MNKISVQAIMEAKKAKLQSILSVSLNHPVSQGSHCESSWIELLRNFLPNRYGITKGFVFDSRGNISEQIDIIIYDTTYSPLVYATKNDEKYVTIESVYAVFECKPKISKTNIDYAEKKIQSVKGLYCTTREIYIAGKPVEPRTPPPIFGGLLTNTSINARNLKKILKNSGPNVILGFSASGLLFFRNDDTLKTITKNTLLAFFYKLLDMLYKLGTVAAIDIREYSKQSEELKWLFEDDNG